MSMAKNAIVVWNRLEWGNFFGPKRFSGLSCIQSFDLVSQCRSIDKAPGFVRVFGQSGGKQPGHPHSYIIRRRQVGVFGMNARQVYLLQLLENDGQPFLFHKITHRHHNGKTYLELQLGLEVRQQEPPQGL